LNTIIVQALRQALRQALMQSIDVNTYTRLDILSLGVYLLCEQLPVDIVKEHIMPILCDYTFPMYKMVKNVIDVALREIADKPIKIDICWKIESNLVYNGSINAMIVYVLM
jgi:hypothetical protein